MTELQKTGHIANLVGVYLIHTYALAHQFGTVSVGMDPDYCGAEDRATAAVFVNHRLLPRDR